MRILSLDLSSKSSGWCVAEDGKIIDYGCISSTSTVLLKRLSLMKTEIQEIIKKYNIKEIVAEDVPGGAIGNSHTQTVLLWLQGIVTLTAYEIDPKIKVNYLQSSSWRSKIGIHTGRGIKRTELKQQDIDYVKEKYNIIANDDICDSICLLDAYLSGSDDNNEINWA